MISLLNGIVVVAVSYILTFLALPKVISYFRKQQLGQTTREEGPKWHQVKSGTPTMGGVVFLISAMLISLVTSFFTNAFSLSLFLVLLILFIYGMLGFLDDYIKVVMKRNLGLTSLQKLMGQILGAALFAAILFFGEFQREWTMPALEILNNPLLYFIFIIIWIVGFSNAVNLTDGLDGLATGTALIAYSTYAFIAWEQEEYSVLLLSLSIIGGLLAFLFYNKKPAQIFMGDVGSLALGGGLATISILLEREWSLLLIGFIFVMETASVIIQVGSMKIRKKRVFKMSPIHHHFEMSGWSEQKIVFTFWGIGLISSILYLIIF
ncbi:phospho-N-acetylmuramoyl-pentapeptide-transferase [Lacticigenium naphthae]|uniref:phospho-N-acetylmuramoyl-pentapeptide- transferase n=1 Tax=Lacticigenium naphthae TaxID=515351 RepID=UPI000417D9EC|nr:phospho-N-acetylmuramoyl-pentapeptide-transferase [Lacticigenium naphthae]